MSMLLLLATLCDPIDGSPAGSSVPGILSKNTGVGCISSSNAHMHAKLLQSCPTLCIPMDIGTWIYLLAFFFVPLVHISVSVPVPCCLADCSFVVQSEVRTVDSSCSIPFSQDHFGNSGSLCFHTNYEILCSSSVKNTIGSLIGIALNLQIVLGSIVIFTILILPIQKHGISLHLSVLSFFSFFHQCLVVFCIQSFVNLGKFIPKYYLCLFVIFCI